MITAPKTALVVLFEGVEEVEAVTPIDLLRRAHVEVTTASLGPARRVVGRNHIALEADVELSAVTGKDFDAVVLPGGPGVKHLRASPEIVALAKQQAAAPHRVLAAICAAPTVLKDAGVLPGGRKFTAHFSVEAELPELRKTEAVVRDGNLITSRGAGTAIPFALEIITALVSADVAKQVADGICYPR